MDYDESLHAFAVACVRSEPGRVGDEESSTSSLKLLDDKSFECTFLSLDGPAVGLSVLFKQYSANSPVRPMKR